jgi:methyl-accepting chemotaxis protein
MTTSEFARLRRRVEAYDESQRALADTVLDIKETVDGHTAALADVKETVGNHTATLDQHTATLDQHTATLDQHTATLDQHTGLLTEILRRLPEPPSGPDRGRQHRSG